MNFQAAWWGQIPLFQNLPEREIALFFSRFPGIRKTFEPGQFIFFYGDELKQFVLLTKGRAVSRIPREKGDGVMAAYFDAPDYLAPGIVFSSNPVSPVEVQTLTRAETHAWNVEDIWTFAGESSGFLKNLLRILGDRIQFLASKVGGLRKMPLKVKIVNYLLSLPRIAPGTVELPLSKDALSEYFAVARPSFSRALKELVDQGILRFEKRIVSWNSDSELELAVRSIENDDR